MVCVPYYSADLFMFLMILFMLGTFIANFVHVLVLLDSGISRFFVSSSFSCGFSIMWEALNRKLRVSKHDDHSVSATDIYRVVC